MPTGGFRPQPSYNAQRDLQERVRKLEGKMMRKIVEFKKTDGLTPGRSEEPGKPFLLKSPLNLNIEAGATQVIKLGISCNLPCLVSRENETKVFAPGQQLEVSVKGPALVGERLVFGVGETLARCYVLDSTNLEIADGPK